MTNISTNIFAQNTVLNELKKKGFTVISSRRDFIVNQKRINVRGCNYDNDWARRSGTKKRVVLGGWDKLNPEKFDYFIFVSFNNNYDDLRYFISTQKEVQQFPITTLKGKELGLKNLTLFKNDENSDRIVKDSENKWEKII